MASFDVLVRTRGSLHPDGKPSEFISDYTAVITCTNDETGGVSRVGRVAAHRINAALAHNAGVRLFDVCDSHSHELHVVHALLYEPGHYGLREGIQNRFDAYQTDILVLDYIVLVPKWRRLKIGLLAVRKLVDLIGGGCGLVVVDIAPLRQDAAKAIGVPPSWIPRNKGKKTRREAELKLRRYFRRMGFERIGRSPYYAMPLNQVTPSARELLRGVPRRGADRPCT